MKDTRGQSKIALASGCRRHPCEMVALDAPSLVCVGSSKSSKKRAYLEPTTRGVLGSHDKLCRYYFFAFTILVGLGAMSEGDIV